MTADRIAVTLAGLAGVAWVNWYFFLAGRGAAVAAEATGSGPQRVRIEVKGGYSPSVVRVRAGQPVKLEFYRDETSSCTEEVVLPDFGIRTYLPAHQTTSIRITPAAGSYEFACGMGMVRGKIVAEEG